jgi:hypothetical protein
MSWQEILRKSNGLRGSYVHFSCYLSVRQQMPVFVDWLKDLKKKELVEE